MPQVTVNSYSELSTLYRRMATRVWPALGREAEINQVLEVARHVIPLTPRDTGRLQHAWSAVRGATEGSMGSPGGPRTVTRAEIKSQLGPGGGKRRALYVNAARKSAGSFSYAKRVLIEGFSRQLASGVLLSGLNRVLSVREDFVFQDAWRRALREGRIF